MKTCVKAELQVPSESILAWIRERFPELPDDVQIHSLYASSYGGVCKEVKITVEHTRVDTDEVIVVEETNGT